MKMRTIEILYKQLRISLSELMNQNNLTGKKLQVSSHILKAVEAIGTPQDQDYPIQQGKEHMIEAVFEGARGQAFTDQVMNYSGPIEDLMTMDISTNAQRAIFIAGLNAVYRYCKICNKTVHCRDNEPVECAKRLHEIIEEGKKVLLVGHQPRFLQELVTTNPLRVLDLDQSNIGTEKHGIKIESPDNTKDAIDWCDCMLATGSTIVNGTIDTFLNSQKRVIFFGVTISAASEILDLEVYCQAPER